LENPGLKYGIFPSITVVRKESHWAGEHVPERKRHGRWRQWKKLVVGRTNALRASWSELLLARLPSLIGFVGVLDGRHPDCRARCSAGSEAKQRPGKQS
jgi:hypothetical protein